MNVTVELANTAYRLARTFKHEAQLILQVAGGNNVVIARDQAGAQNGILSLTSGGSIQDGFVVNAQSTFPPTGQPFIFVWQGELWYASDIDNSQFALTIATETSQRN